MNFKYGNVRRKGGIIMATMVQLINGSFSDLCGNPVAFGTLKLRLSQDASLLSGGQLSSARTVLINLDGNGNVQGSPIQSVWPTDQMSPSTVSYVGWVYSSEGQLVWGPNYNLLVPSGATFDVSAWVPQ